MMRFTSDEERLRAVAERNRAADGTFVYGVTTTKVYCRPSCPSRRPLPAHTRFFETWSEAETAGFRACRRCRPTEPSTTQRIVATVLRVVEERAAAGDPAPTLAELAHEGGVSPAHLQRTFTRAVGMTPKQFVAAVRETRFARAVRADASVTEALYEAGYESSRALYEHVRERFGMAPRALRHGGGGEEIVYTLVDTALGRLLIAATTEGLVAVRFGSDDEALLRELKTDFPRAAFRRDPEALAEQRARIVEYFRGTNDRLDVTVAAPGSAFQRRVWHAVQKIPAGETRSYSQIAEMLGRPRAARAVARALAGNPVALVVPCHRVIRADGALAGFRWGVARKRELLKLERSSPVRSPEER